MSIREDLLERAKESTIAAALRAGTDSVVVSVFAKFNVSRVSDLKFRALDAIASYIEEVEALPAPPPKVPVEFLIGERVKLNSPHSGRLSSSGTVIGYEVRYMVKLDASVVTPAFGQRAERLTSLETAPTSGEPVHFVFDNDKYYV